MPRQPTDSQSSRGCENPGDDRKDLMPYRTIIEPFRIHTVQAIDLPTVEEREAALQRAGFNLFGLHADQVIRLDKLNPQMAARMVSAFNPWMRYPADRRQLMRSELRRIAGTEGLSPDVSEIVNNALSMEKVSG